jgi:tetratricopeptide (TPR) repeat protein
MLGKLQFAPPAQWREMAVKMLAPPMTSSPPTELPLSEHTWLDHTQFSALATLEQIPVTMERAKQATDAGDYGLAETLLQSVLQIAPKFPSALHQLGIVAIKQGRPSLAIRSIQRALSTAEAVPLRRCDLALAFATGERYEEAIASYRRALELNPQFNRAHQELGELLCKLNRKEEARPHFQAAGLPFPGEETMLPASHAAPDNACEATALPAVSMQSSELVAIRELTRERQIDEARRRLQQHLAKFPGCVEAMLLLAEILHEEQEHAAAGEHVEAALDLEPSAQGYLLHGQVLEAQGHDVEALASYELALSLEAPLAAAQIQAANLALKLNQPALAEKHFRAALQQAPRDQQLWNSLGLALYEQGQNAAAIACYEQAITFAKPQAFPVAEANMSFALLQQGNFAAGWQAYEARWSCAASTPRRSQLPMPEWDGSSLAGKSLLIHAEQGLGDEIMFATCYQELCQEAKRIVATCDPRMKSIFQRSFPGIEWVGVTRGQEYRWQPLPAQRCDLHSAAGSILQYRRRDLADFPKQQAFLEADPALLAAWKARFAELPTGARIGIAWQGGEQVKDRQRRCLDIQQLAPLFAVPGVEWINLQHGEVADDLQATGTRIHDWPEFDLRNDLENLAARIAACDLVISVGNAAVHLAGALGVPTWCLLPATGAWRWGPVNQATPWYKSVRPLSQTAAGQWHTLLDSIAAILPEWLAAQASGNVVPTYTAAQTANPEAAPQPLSGKPKAPLAIPHWLQTPAASNQDLLQ